MFKNLGQRLMHVVTTKIIRLLAFETGLDQIRTWAGCGDLCMTKGENELLFRVKLNDSDIWP